VNIKMQFGSISKELSHPRWDLAFVGSAIDARGVSSIEYVHANTICIVPFTYIPKEFQITLDGKAFDKDDLERQITALEFKTVLLDSTTLSFAELLILLQALKNLSVSSLSILYVEPGGYKRKKKSDSILHMRDFELSDETIGFEAIPGHGLSLSTDSEQKIVFLCGYESERMDRAMEDSEVVSKNCSCIFGVPPMSPGWEMDSFDNNISVIRERKISGGINFCGSTNPLSVFQKLEMIYNGLDEGGQLFVVPLATKPMNVGACLFLITKPKDRVAVLYDHPIETRGRAEEISRWHLYDLRLN
jgi:hypothetical protein